MLSETSSEFLRLKYFHVINLNWIRSRLNRIPQKPLHDDWHAWPIFQTGTDAVSTFIHRAPE